MLVAEKCIRDTECIRDTIVSEYLVMMPPSFEEWTSQGPQVGTMFMKMIVLRNMIVMRNMMMIRLIN